MRMQMRIRVEKIDTTRHAVKGVFEPAILSFLREYVSKIVDEEWYERRR
jgi:hypothetical protein